MNLLQSELDGLWVMHTGESCLTLLPLPSRGDPAKVPGCEIGVLLGLSPYHFQNNIVLLLDLHRESPVVELWDRQLVMIINHWRRNLTSPENTNSLWPFTMKL